MFLLVKRSFEFIIKLFNVIFLILLRMIHCLVVPYVGGKVLCAFLKLVMFVWHTCVMTSFHVL